MHRRLGVPPQPPVVDEEESRIRAVKEGFPPEMVWRDPFGKRTERTAAGVVVEERGEHAKDPWPLLAVPPSEPVRARR